METITHSSRMLSQVNYNTGTTDQQQKTEASLAFTSHKVEAINDTSTKVADNQLLKLENQISAISLSRAKEVRQKKQNHITNTFTNALFFHLKDKMIDPDKKTIASYIPVIDDDGFFREISPIISDMLKKIEDEGLDLNEVLDESLSIVTSSNLDYKLRDICCSLLNSIRRFEQEKQQLVNFLGLNKQDYRTYIKNIHELFIEGDYAYKCKKDFNNGINGLGAYVFEDEEGYVSRCLNAFSYSIEQLVIKNNPLSLHLVKNIIGFFSSFITTSTTALYTATFSKEFSKGVVSLLSRGKIARYVITDCPYELQKILAGVKVRSSRQEGMYDVYIGKDLLEGYINHKLSDDHKIKLKTSKEDPNYYVVDTINNTTQKHPNIFEVLYEEPELNLEVSFDTINYNKEAYLECLINTFNNEVSQTPTDLEYTTSVVKLVASLQRAHLLADANGRYSAFNLLPVLLMKKGLWLTKQPFNLWYLMDGSEPEDLAKIFYSLCIPAPNIQPNNVHHWMQAIPMSEQIRIACVTGNQSFLKDLLDNAPQLLLVPVATNSQKNKKMPIKILKEYGHKDLYDSICSHPHIRLVPELV